jgi:alanine-glyoxylate transaminase/(R)-3-amino-2-methylpropionate-pyruvate transaminase
MAKGVANGMPLGVTVATPEIADAFKALQLSTFGGNPISSAAANATLEVIESQDLAGNAETQGALLRAGLEELQGKYPKMIGDVRGMGLMQAMEFVVDETVGDRTHNPEAAAKFFEACRDRGLLVGKGGLYGNVLRIAPALNVGASEIQEALDVMAEALATFAS